MARMTSRCREFTLSRLAKVQRFRESQRSLSRASRSASALFELYVGTDYYESELDFSFYFPSEQMWRKYDDRTIACTVIDPSLELLDGSVAGAER